MIGVLGCRAYTSIPHSMTLFLSILLPLTGLCLVPFLPHQKLPIAGGEKRLDDRGGDLLEVLLLPQFFLQVAPEECEVTHDRARQGQVQSLRREIRFKLEFHRVTLLSGVEDQAITADPALFAR
jgi:hypothetical protein